MMQCYSCSMRHGYVPALTESHASLVQVFESSGLVEASHSLEVESVTILIHCTFLFCVPSPQVTEHYKNRKECNKHLLDQKLTGHFQAIGQNFVAFNFFH